MIAAADLGLDHEQRQVQDTLRAFFEREAPPARIAELDAGETYPAEILDGMAGLGLWGIAIDEAYGGNPGDATTRCIVVEEIQRAGASLALTLILAATGLLKGRRLTTHWAAADALAEAYPSLAVEADALYVRDGKLRTGAGVTAGLDLALALVEEDLGREIARRVAAQLVMFFKRPGGQLQFSRSGEARPAGRSVLQEVQRWIAGHPEFEHSVAELAKHAGMSPRHFARLFRAEVGMTPAAWVETTRISAARQLLENGHDTPKQVAAKCGFANVDTLRRAFVRHVGITPAEYRKRQAVVEA